MGIIGESGSGKSTLAKIILNILQRDFGSVILFNSDGSKKNITLPNSRIGAVFQDPLGSLNPRMTVSDIVAEPLIVSGCKNKLEIEEKIEKTINKVNLETDLLNRFPQMLSGGQRQRVSIARALVLQPDLLVLDEPTSSLDIHVQGIVLDLLKKLQRLENLTYLFISHDLGVMAEIADRVAVLYQGKIIEQGIMEEILYNPREKYTEKLISAFFDNNI
jgi:ABC-type microcin C transport system duplicated ATPase subunit YejF